MQHEVFLSKPAPPTDTNPADVSAGRVRVRSGSEGGPHAAVDAAADEDPLYFGSPLEPDGPVFRRQGAAGPLMLFIVEDRASAFALFGHEGQHS